MKFKLNIEIDPKRYTRYFDTAPIVSEDTLWALLLEDVIDYIKDGNADIPFNEIKYELEKLLPEERDPYHGM